MIGAVLISHADTSSIRPFIAVYPLLMGVIAFLIAPGTTFGKAAPIVAWAARRVPRQTLTVIVGVAICLVSAYNLRRALV